jgi:hypothetical protein
MVHKSQTLTNYRHLGTAVGVVTPIRKEVHKQYFLKKIQEEIFLSKSMTGNKMAEYT